MTVVKTVLSAATSYLSPAGFLTRVDHNTVGDLCADRPNPTTSSTRVAYADLLTNANLQAALDDASGDLESAVFVGGKYTPDDLAALVAVPSGATVPRVGGSKIFRIITEIAKVYLCDRRPEVKVPENFLDGMERAQASLTALALGTEIFGFVEAADAGRMGSVPVSPEDVRLRFGPVIQAERYFGIRSDRAALNSTSGGAAE